MVYLFIYLFIYLFEIFLCDKINTTYKIKLWTCLMGDYTPNKNLACFVPNLKIINIK